METIFLIVWSEIIQEAIVAIIIVAIIGVAVDLTIEMYKNRLTLITEINKKRVEKIAECWKEHNDYLLSFYKLDFKMREIREKQQLPVSSIVSNLQSECDHLNEKLLDIEALISSHRFWLGEKIEQKTCRVYHLFEKYYEAFCAGELEKCDDWKNKIKASMLDVDDVLEELINKLKEHSRYKAFIRRLKSLFKKSLKKEAH